MNKTLAKTFWLIVLIAQLTGCATDSTHQPSGGGYREAREDVDEEDYNVPDNSRAHPAAYAMDSFVIRKKSPKRSPSSEMKFFFKNCEVSNGRTYISRTSYNCDMPDR